jgi:hypothetical protein
MGMATAMIALLRKPRVEPKAMDCSGFRFGLLAFRTMALRFFRAIVVAYSRFDTPGFFIDRSR